MPALPHGPFARPRAWPILMAAGDGKKGVEVVMQGYVAETRLHQDEGLPHTGGLAARGAFAGLKWLRFSMVVLALLDAAAHLFASPGQTQAVTFWLETEVAAYVLVSVVYLLGLRSWYTPAIAYSVLNLVIFFLSAFVALPGITHGTLIGHVEFAQYSFGRAFSLLAWVYLIAAGLVLNRLDKGSKLDALLRES